MYVTVHMLHPEIEPENVLLNLFIKAHALYFTEHSLQEHNSQHTLQFMSLQSHTQHNIIIIHSTHLFIKI